MRRRPTAADPTPGDLRRLRQQLSVESRRVLDSQSEFADKLQLVYRSISSAAPRLVSREALQGFQQEHLTPERRERIETLNSRQAYRELVRMYLQRGPFRDRGKGRRGQRREPSRDRTSGER